MSINTLNIMKTLSFIIVMLLTGCATTDTKIVYQEVRVPVMSHCINKQDLPQIPQTKFQTLTITDNDYTKINTLLTDWLLMKEYINKTSIIIELCSGETEDAY